MLTESRWNKVLDRHLGATHGLKEEHKDDSVRDRSLTVKRTLDAASRSKAAKTSLDTAARSKSGVHIDIAGPAAKVKEREHEYSLKEGVVMNEDFSPIADVITLVANDQHAEATSIVNDLLSARVLDSLQGHKQTIAQSLFAPSADSLAEKVEELDEKSPDAGKIEKNYQAQNKKIQDSGRDANAKYYGKTPLKEEEDLVQEDHESVEDFVKRGGKIKQVAPGKAHGSQKPQTIKKAKKYFVKKA